VSKNPGAEKFKAALALNGCSTSPSPVVVHRDTALELLEDTIAQSRFVLATDDFGSIVGLISSDEILKRLQSANARERARWAEMPLSSLINPLHAARRSEVSRSLDSAIECTAIAEDGHLIGIAIAEDLFLSWNRIGPLLSGAIADPLTGLMTRLTYERRLREEWQRAARTGSSVGIVIVDLDHFKTINDEWGHQVGDDVLRHVAGRLEQSLRSYDVLARYGGDEFTALCLGCRPEEIEIPVQRIVQSLNDSPASWQGLSVPLAASVGAAVRHDDFENSDPIDLFVAADQCMYQAKLSGTAGYRIEFGAGLPSHMTLVRRQCDPTHDGVARSR
jgi:diguanylate cyclase (GGDEF)-like protein